MKFEEMNHNQKMSFICKRLEQQKINNQAKKTILSKIKKNW